MLVHRVPAWRFDLSQLKDDTEEDLVGSDWHQDAIQASYEGLWLVGPERGQPWQVSRQLMVLMGDVGPKRDWRPSPDIMVHPTAGQETRDSFDARRLGVPPLLIEVASQGTYRYDLEAKRDGYMVAGVREYLVFDPTGGLLGEQVRAWRAVDGEVVPWEVDEDGRWHSREFPVSFAPEGVLLRVYDEDGQRQPTFREQAGLRAREQRRAEEERLRAGEERRRAEEERRRAEEQQRQAAEERARADEERRRAEELERRLAEQLRRVAELEALLRPDGQA